MNTPDLTSKRRLHGLPRLIFASRWLQLPLYLGLILAQAVYVYHFWVELVHLVEAAFGSQAALQQLVTSIGYKAVAIKDAAGVVTGYEPIKQLQTLVLVLVDVFGRSLPVYQQALLLQCVLVAIPVMNMACAALRSHLLTTMEFVSLGVLAMTVGLGLFVVDSPHGGVLVDTVGRGSFRG